MKGKEIAAHLKKSKRKKFSHPLPEKNKATG